MCPIGSISKLSSHEPQWPLFPRNVNTMSPHAGKMQTHAQAEANARHTVSRWSHGFTSCFNQLN
uniref:Uncharacterized protein n=1 Tax=Anguilla anguilla TaxID=7936 RepID=A0A0E9WFB6_ANGAN